ncbi:MAG: AAA family ATPase, partial [Deltaproteobacteria bacterium]|nr:AAA family ATPase [Deltaproteobacteria bacterium]
MSKPITKVELVGFRGATVPFDLDFDPQKDMTMLFGENGSGKSSILDAIDIICNSGIGSLEDISMGHSPGKYLCSLGSPHTTLSAIIHSGHESWTGTMQRNSVSTTGPDIKPRVKILRRSKILALVTAQPRERYDALKHFIDIGVVEQSERALQQKLQDVNSEINNLIATKERQLDQLENVWEAEQRPGPGQTAMAWARDKVDTGITELNAQLEYLIQVVEAIVAVITAKNDHSSKSSIAADSREDLSEVNQKIQDAPSLNAAIAIHLIESLTKAREYINAEPGLDKCPTCQRPIAREELISIVDEQLNRMTELKALSDRKNEAQRQLRTATDIASHAEPVFLTALQQLQHVVGASDIPEIVGLNIVWPDWSAEQQDFDTLQSIGKAFESIQPTLEQKRNDAQHNVSQFNSIKEWYCSIRTVESEAANLDRIRHGLQRAFDLIHEKRISFTQRILDDIAGEANRLFQKIHPNESMDLATLSMDEARQGSVHQIGTFHGYDDIPPQAVFSDSHLDTLGFCVWLALAKRESPENTVILIDGIFSSVDASHLGRVIDLLGAEGQNFLQVIVATHYRLWWDRCQNAQGIQRVHLG